MASSDPVSYMEIVQRAFLQLGISHGIHLSKENDTFTATFYLPRHDGFNGSSKCCRDCAVNFVSKMAYNYLKGVQLLPIDTPIPSESNVCVTANKRAGEEVRKF